MPTYGAPVDEDGNEVDISEATGNGYYVDGVLGSDGGGGLGTQAAPWATIAHMLAVAGLASGDFVNLAGTFRESNTIATMSGVTWRQWVSKTQATIRGDVVVALSGWTLDTGAYYKAVGDGLNIKSVAIDWDTSVDSSGRHYGHLAAAADRATCQATDNTYFYDTSTTPDRLYVRIGANINPSGVVSIGYCVGGVNGLQVNACTNCVFSGVNFALWCDSSPGLGYAIFAVGNGNTITGCRTDDTGFHALGFVNGATTSNNLITNCIASGLGDGDAGGNGTNAFVFHATTAANLTNTNNVAIGCTIYRHTKLGRSGSQVAAAPTGVCGCLSHCSGGGTLSGIRWENITVISLGDLTSSSDASVHTMSELGYIFSADNVGAVSDVRDASTYPVIVKNCTFTNVRRQTLLAGIAFVGCTIDIREYDLNMSFHQNDATVDKNGFFGCAITFYTTNNSDIFYMNNASHVLTLESCSIAVLDSGVTNKDHVLFRNYSSTPTWHIHGCAIGFVRATGGNPRYFSYSTSFVNAVVWDVGGNAYFGIDDSTWWNDTRAHWMNGTVTQVNGGLGETDQLFAASHPFIDPTVNLDLSRGSTIYARKLPPTFSPKISYGINGVPFSFRFGAWQYGWGGIGGLSRSRERVSRGR